MIRIGKVSLCVWLLVLLLSTRTAPVSAEHHQQQHHDNELDKHNSRDSTSSPLDSSSNKDKGGGDIDMGNCGCSDQASRDMGGGVRTGAETGGTCSIEGGTDTSITDTISDTNPAITETVGVGVSGSRADRSRYSGHLNELVSLVGGAFFMGTNKPKIFLDGESPAREVVLQPFAIDKYAVTNEEFDQFVSETGYATESESFGWSFVFHTAIPAALQKGVTQAVKDVEWWSPVDESYWFQPEGPDTDVFAAANYRGKHPVVQVSWSDANDYCHWRNGSRLPTEAEWEYAARGGLAGKMFPWGNSYMPGGEHRMNIYQGRFPNVNSEDDGYAFTSPVDAYSPQNEYGLYNMMGNVWEWVDDWWAEPRESPNFNGSPPTEKVKKGGSFLCHKSYCYRYRNAARTKATPDSATQNGGFRCAKS